VWVLGAVLIGIQANRWPANIAISLIIGVALGGAISVGRKRLHGR
jgi:hypothetical protein